MTETYLPKDLTWDRNCVEWIWANILELRQGEWPDIATTGYTDMPGGKVGRHGKFEMACLVAAEVSIRALRCGLDGFLVEEKYGKGKDEAQIAKERWLSVGEVINRINKVLGYSASGRKPRWLSTRYRKAETYSQWKQNRHYRRNDGS